MIEAGAAQVAHVRGPGPARVAALVERPAVVSRARIPIPRAALAAGTEALLQASLLEVGLVAMPQIGEVVEPAMPAASRPDRRVAAAIVEEGGPWRR